MLSYDFHLTITEIKVVCSLEFISVVSVPSSQTENSSIIWRWRWNYSDIKNLILQNHLSVCFITDETTRLFITYVNLWLSMCAWIYLANPNATMHYWCVPKEPQTRREGSLFSMYFLIYITRYCTSVLVKSVLVNSENTNYIKLHIERSSNL